MTNWFLSGKVLDDLLAPREGRAVFGPVKTRRLAWLDALGEEFDAESLYLPRAAQSPKGFFLPPAELLARYGREAGAVAATTTVELTVLLGVRACELRARKYLDDVFLDGDFRDEAYRNRRETTLIVSNDCVDCTETCCCTLVGGRPYPTEGFDVNLTPLQGGFVAEAGSDRGREWLESSGAKHAEADAGRLAERDRLRAGMVERLKRQNARFTFQCDDQRQPKLPEIAEPAWQKFAADCVECGACTNICPTCHCFYLFDQAQSRQHFERVRNWDSCLLSTYHRMAGGLHMKLSPRPKLLSRLANRILHKFTYSPQQHGMTGCVGCGRCIEACLGAIDIRQVVQELSQ